MRRGLTLLEVLISILIVSIGIFGLLALLPIAGQQARRAIDKDFAAQAGRNAAVEFSTRNMGRMSQSGVTFSNWLDAGGSQFVPGNIQGFLIDPMAVSRGLGNQFPAVGGVSAIPRVTLRAGDWIGPPVPAPGAMSQPLADFVFTAHDDLVIETSPQIGDPPLNQLTPEDNRQTNRQWSWMVMLMPRLDAAGRSSDSYRASFIVFHNRSLDAQEDKVVQIAAGEFYGGGVGGGDAGLSVRAGQPDTDLEGAVKDRWCCLAPSTAVSYFRWYRLVDSDGSIDTSGTPRRDVTLQGDDWPTDPQWVPAALRPGFATPYVIIPDNVVAVYERTVRVGELSFVDP